MRGVQEEITCPVLSGESQRCVREGACGLSFMPSTWLSDNAFLEEAEQGGKGVRRYELVKPLVNSALVRLQ